MQNTAAESQESLSTGNSLLLHPVLWAPGPDAGLEHCTSLTWHYAVPMHTRSIFTLPWSLAYFYVTCCLTCEQQNPLLSTCCLAMRRLPCYPLDVHCLAVKRLPCYPLDVRCLTMRRLPCYPLDTRCLAMRRLPHYALCSHSVSVRRLPMRRLPVLLWMLVLYSAVSFVKTSTLPDNAICLFLSKAWEGSGGLSL